MHDPGNGPARITSVFQLPAESEAVTCLKDINARVVGAFALAADRDKQSKGVALIAFVEDFSPLVRLFVVQ